MRLLILLSLLFISCSKSEEAENCIDGYPKVFGNQIIIEQAIETYQYESGKLTFTSSFRPDAPTTGRTITLLSPTELSDSSHPVNIDFELIDGCIKDWRNYERKRIDNNCTLIKIDHLSVGVNGSWIGGLFDCNKSDSIIIEEALTAFAATEIFDSVQIDRWSVELQLIK